MPEEAPADPEADDDEARGGEPGQEAEARLTSPYRWIEGSLRLGGYGGWLSSDRGPLEFGPGAAEVGGGRLRLRVSSPLSVEFGLGGGLSDRFVIDPLAEGGPRVVDTVPLRWAVVDGAVQVALTGARTWHGLQPFVLLGTGLMVGLDQPVHPLEVPPEPPEEGEEESGEAPDGTDEETPDLSPFRYEVNTAPIFQAGLGVEVLLSRRLGLSVEARDLIFRLRAPDGFFQAEVLEALEEAGARVPQESQWTNNLHLSVGLWYYF